MSLRQGKRVTLQATVRNEAGALANPTTQQFRVLRPDGSVLTPIPTSTTVGVWTASVLLDQPGLWWWEFTGTGAVETAGTASFYVEPAPF